MKKVQGFSGSCGVEVLDANILAYIGYRKSQTATEYLSIQRSLHDFLWLNYAFRKVDANEGHSAVVCRILSSGEETRQRCDLYGALQRNMARYGHGVLQWH